MTSVNDARLCAAARRILDSDYLLSRTLRTRGSLSIPVPATRSHDFAPVTLGDLVRPLLMAGEVSDSLYNYQRTGVAWLLGRHKAILADDMGLGKTAQAITAIKRLVRSGQVTWCVVVAPSTLLANWVSEFTKWAPELVVQTLAPNPADRSKIWRRARNRCHVTVTSYDHLRVAGASVRAALPDLVVADEAHRLRTEGSLTCSEFRDLTSNYKWLLTGTPIENRTDDLAVLLSVLEPARFSAADAVRHESSLKAVVRPYLLRRRKEDVLPELPEVIEQNELLELTPHQKSAYNAAIRSANLRSNADYLALFNRLRAICDLDADTGSSSKIDRAADLLAAAQANGYKAVVFSYLLDPLRALGERLISRSIRYRQLLGDMSLTSRDRAIKEFKSEPDCTALLASMRVASEGLTLTEASIVLFINRWWNPSANTQARDRVVRIGQMQPVTVINFTCAKTVEERLPGILAKKLVTFETVVESLAIDSGGLLEPVD